jgi:hypothetical protein
LDIDRIVHIDRRPPIVADWHAAESLAAITVTDETSFDSPAPDLSQVTEIWALGIRGEALTRLLAAADPTILHLEAVHDADLSAVSSCTALAGFAVDWNTKLETIDFLAHLPRLQALSLVDIKRLHDLSPLSALIALRSLQLAGGIWSKLVVDTLEPLAQLTVLAELRMISLKVRDGRLEPLGRLTRLERMAISSNAFDMEEFARLSVQLPDVECSQLYPYQSFGDFTLPRHADPVAALDEFGDATVLVTGKRKPFLRARTDRDKLIRHCAAFEAARRSSRAS